jgi:hypothetical protein
MITVQCVACSKQYMFMNLSAISGPTLSFAWVWIHVLASCIPSDDYNLMIFWIHVWCIGDWCTDYLNSCMYDSQHRALFNDYMHLILSISITDS